MVVSGRTDIGDEIDDIEILKYIPPSVRVGVRAVHDDGGYVLVALRRIYNEFKHLLIATHDLSVTTIVRIELRQVINCGPASLAPIDIQEDII